MGAVVADRQFDRERFEASEKVSRYVLARERNAKARSNSRHPHLQMDPVAQCPEAECAGQALLAVACIVTGFPCLFGVIVNNGGESRLKISDNCSHALAPIRMIAVRTMTVT